MPIPSGHPADPGTVNVPGAYSRHGGHLGQDALSSRTRELLARKEPPPAPAPQVMKVEHQPPPAAGVIYTCPMHPEVQQPTPGICPICKMKLVLKKDEPEEQKHEHAH